MRKFYLVTFEGGVTALVEAESPEEVFKRLELSQLAPDVDSVVSITLDTNHRVLLK